MVKYFIAGFLIALLFDNVYIILSCLTEWIKNIISIKITECAVKISKISKEVEQQQINPIGFSTLNDNKGEEFSNGEK